MTIRSRFAPSPTGYLHIGGARTALYAWAYARKHGGTFILRVEDTDVARSTPEAVTAIIDGMKWLGLDYDEGPFYQSERTPRYKEVVAEMLARGDAYHCYMSQKELDALRHDQRERDEKPRYDGTWRPESNKTLPAIPADVAPVVRFRNPFDGVVTWHDAVKGKIEIANRELDDLIIARADGTPTYNFCVCVDDWDMQITHVIRGDDHVNNTPRQINILRALGATVPVYAHLSMILGDDGQKLSKRHGAVSVMEYPANGYVRDAVVNYLARLGWSHQDAEVFSMDEFCTWFDLDHITPSAAQFNTEKLNWLNHEYIKKMDETALGALLVPHLESLGFDLTRGPAPAIVAHALRERAPTLVEMAAQAQYFYKHSVPDTATLAPHLFETTPHAVADLVLAFATMDNAAWTKANISSVIKSVAATHALKMPQLMMPLRIILTAQTQSPAVDVLMVVLGREETVRRLDAKNWTSDA